VQAPFSLFQRLILFQVCLDALIVGPRRIYAAEHLPVTCCKRVVPIREYIRGKNRYLSPVMSLPSLPSFFNLSIKPASVRGVEHAHHGGDDTAFLMKRYLPLEYFRRIAVEPHDETSANTQAECWILFTPQEDRGPLFWNLLHSSKDRSSAFHTDKTRPRTRPVSSAVSAVRHRQG